MVQVEMARWRPHLRAAKAAGVSVSRYAREHGLSRHTLYAALRAERERRAMVEAGGRRPPKRARTVRRSLPTGVSAFVPVAVSERAARLAVRLPNGVSLECRDLDEVLLGGLIAALSKLPCFA
jgi:transposase-like protein